MIYNFLAIQIRKNFYI